MEELGVAIVINNDNGGSWIMLADVLTGFVPILGRGFILNMSNYDKSEFLDRMVGIFHRASDNNRHTFCHLFLEEKSLYVLSDNVV